MAKRPNILWILLDSARVDNLSCYGYERKTTENIDRIAEKSAVFENVFSTARWTPPSHASMFTGLYPSGHGVLNPNLTLSGRHTTIAEVLSREGYETFMLTPTPQISFYRNINKGFSETFESYRGKLDLRDPALYLSLLRNVLYGWDKQTHYFNQVIKRNIDRFNRNDKEFFIFANYVTVHWPYTFPKGFNRFPLPDGVDERKIRDIAGCKSMYNKVSSLVTGKKTDSVREYPYNYFTGSIEISKQEFSALKSLYDNQLCYLDHKVGELYRFLDERGLLDDTIIVLTSDHGEMFGEHDMATHGHCLYDSVLKVPLIMHYPKKIKPQRNKSLTSLVDVFPTLLGLTGVTLPRKLDGIDLFSGAVREEIVAQSGRPKNAVKKIKKAYPGFDLSIIDKEISCIRTKKYKYIMASDGSEELYDVEKDPSEEKNIALERTDISAKLRTQLEKILRANEKERVKGRLRELKSKGKI